ncbi:hypothetical protein DFJ67_2261 [Asanoa ferruginea]|uniref:DUF6457 domain-containing protein n=1 Tax=Asanoa ferruginea TaxID=53367 RepID=A0A3D9ZIE0_9ACTN|nr:DUF6457 domain-containing protein [Asanoa ferruginea]REF96284.1 hypothetical protein DFJ67_2261 [Asanoa ferruginea]GIF46934.1 hypothetical protein Afe04nite_14730 [Asanoa ferruginea]
MTLDEWVKAACAELGIAPADASVSLVLNLARDVAHNTVRPAAPVTAYLLGLAVGRGADPQEAAAALTALATAQAGPAAASDRDRDRDR